MAEFELTAEAVFGAHKFGGGAVGEFVGGLGDGEVGGGVDFLSNLVGNIVLVGDGAGCVLVCGF